MSAALAEGWAVSIPDHEGPLGIWGAPYEPGYHVLDGLRAALNTEALNLSARGTDGAVGLLRRRTGHRVGHRGATPTYAPELNLVGAVLGSPVGDLGHTFRRLNGSFFSGLPALVVAALSHVYPDLDRVINEHVTVEGKAMLTDIQRMTTAQAVIKLIRKDMDTMVDATARRTSCGTPEVQHVFDSIKLGTAAPSIPVLVVQAVHDRIVSVADIDELTDTYSSGGADVTYHRDMLSEHMLLHPMSAPMTLRWLRDRFAGRPLVEQSGPDQVADAAEPVDLPGHAPAGPDHGEGGDGSASGSAAAVGAGSVRHHQVGHLEGGHAPRSSRLVDSAQIA